MNTPLSRNVGRGVPVSPARGAPFAASRNLVVQSPSLSASGYYQASTSAPHAAAATGSTSMNLAGYAHGRSTGTVSAQGVIGNVTSVTLTSASPSQSVQLGDPRIGAALTSPRCDSPTKGPYGMAHLASEALMPDATPPPLTVSIRTRMSPNP